MEIKGNNVDPTPLANNETSDKSRRKSSLDSDDSDDDNERPWFNRYFGKIEDGSLRGGIFSMASITFGSGCLMFPFAVYNVGPILALVLFIIVALLSYWTLYVLVWSGMKTGLMDYNKMLEELVVLTIGVIMTYQSIISDFSLKLLKSWFDVNETPVLKLILMFSMMISFQLPLSLLRDISKLQYASIVGTFALIYTIIVMLIEFPGHLKSNLKDNKEINWFPKIDLTILDTISIFLYGYCSHNGIFPVFQELKNPTKRRNLKVLDRSIILESVLYLIISSAGFFAAYPYMETIILKSKIYEDAFIKVGIFTLIICLTCTMAINYNIMRQSFKTMFFSGNVIPFTYELIIAICLYSVMTYATYSISDITSIMGFIGGFCTCVICYINPFIIYIQCCGLKKTHWKVFSGIIAAIVMTLVGSAATIHSVIDLVNGGHSKN